MASIDLYRSNPIVLQPGQTREFIMGEPAILGGDVFYGLSIIPRPILGQSVTLVETHVRMINSASPRMHYTVRNDSQTEPALFHRSSVRIS